MAHLAALLPLNGQRNRQMKVFDVVEHKRRVDDGKSVECFQIVNYKGDAIKN